MHFAIRVRADIARGIVQQWADEHAGYYGRPHGFRLKRLPRECWPVALVAAPWGDDWRAARCGYSFEGPRHPLMAGALNFETANVWLIEFESGDTAVIRFFGRRHGQSRVGREVIEGRLALLKYETGRPDLPLWGTAT